MKGIPSLFVDVLPLYADEQKRKVIEETVEGFREKSEKNEPLDGKSI